MLCLREQTSQDGYHTGRMMSSGKLGTAPGGDLLVLVVGGIRLAQL